MRTNSHKKKQWKIKLIKKGIKKQKNKIKKMITKPSIKIKWNKIIMNEIKK